MPTLTPAQETSYIEAAKLADKKAFDALARYYWPIVYEYAMTHLGDHDRAEDAAQETLIFAWENLREFDATKGKFRDWLLATCRNMNKRVDRDYKPRRVALTENIIDPRAVDPLEAMLEAEEKKENPPPDPLDGLPPMQREIMEMLANGFTYSAVAEQLGITANAVRQNLFKARKKLSTNNIPKR